jgi:hypothetical protein
VLRRAPTFQEPLQCLVIPRSLYVREGHGIES